MERATIWLSMAYCRRLDPFATWCRGTYASVLTGYSSAHRRFGHAFRAAPLGAQLPAQGETMDAQISKTSFEAGKCLTRSCAAQNEGNLRMERQPSPPTISAKGECHHETNSG